MLDLCPRICAVRLGYGEPKPFRDSPVYTIDPPEDIRRCESCTVPAEQCNGHCKSGEAPHPACSVKRKYRSSGKRTAMDPAHIVETARLTQMGWTARWIAEKLDVSKGRVEYLRKLAKKAGLL